MMSQQAAEATCGLYLHLPGKQQVGSMCTVELLNPFMLFQQAGEAIGSSAISFSNSRGQMLSTMLGVYAYCVCPVMLDLTDGHVHHLMQIHGTEVCIWADLTPTQAYYKQAEYLRAIIGMVGSARLKEFKIEDLTEEEKLTMQKLRSLKPRSQSEEQLDSIIPHLPEDQRVQATFEMITSWQHAAPQRLPTELNARLGNWFAD